MTAGSPIPTSLSGLTTISSCIKNLPRSVEAVEAGPCSLGRLGDTEDVEAKKRQKTELKRTSNICYHASKFFHKEAHSVHGVVNSLIIYKYSIRLARWAQLSFLKRQLLFAFKKQAKGWKSIENTHQISSAFMKRCPAKH